MDSQVLSDLVVANHILVNEGVLDGFGHISVRDPANPQRFFIARSMAPALVQADDILACDLDSNVIDERGR
jgi:HCOMODA/2-hydroxy-3-carboxy-muconic semialdehyde decarboxylase